MKLPRLRLLSLLLLTVAAMLPSCANVSIPTGGMADAITGQPYASSAASPIKINLFGGDLEQFQAVYPNGPSVAISGLKTSPAFGRAMDSVDSVSRWVGLSKIANGWFGQKSTEIKEAGLTTRTRITSDAATSQAKTAAEAATRQAELNLLSQPATP